MIAITVKGGFIAPKTLIFGIVIGQTKLARPVASTFYPKMVVAIFCQFAVTASTFKYALSQRDTRRNTMRPHLLHRHEFEGIDILSGTHQLCGQTTHTAQATD
jgi:hypothetical protein